MIDEKKLIEELESLPLIHGRYDIAHANGDFISGIETWHETVIKTINKQPKVCPKFSFPTTSELAKEVAEKAMYEYEYKGKTIRQWIDEIQKREWIPCSERLPEIDSSDTDQFVLISCWSKADNYFVQESLVYKDSNNQICFDSLYYKDEVLAWMELPEPYKAGD